LTVDRRLDRAEKLRPIDADDQMRVCPANWRRAGCVPIMDAVRPVHNPTGANLWLTTGKSL